MTEPVLIYDDHTGRIIDVNTNATADELAKFFLQAALPTDAGGLDQSEGFLAPTPESAGPRGRGRPKLGVVAREVTLLQRHWDWLNTQPGGASVALRKLVETARRLSAETDRQRRMQEASFHFMSSIAGDFPNFEEALRALFANDRHRLEDLTTAWPGDVRKYALKLAFGDEDQSRSNA